MSQAFAVAPVNQPGVFDVQRGASDLLMAIQQATTVDECLRLHRLAEDLAIWVGTCSGAALGKATQLNERKP